MNKTAALRVVNNFLKKQKRAGFSMIELLISIIIAGILLLVAFSSIKAPDAKLIPSEAIMGAKIIQVALQQYYSRYGDYPPNPDGQCWVGNLPAAYFPGLVIRGSGNTSPQSSLDGPYFSEECYYYDKGLGFIRIFVDPRAWNPSAGANRAPYWEQTARIGDRLTGATYSCGYIFMYYRDVNPMKKDSVGQFYVPRSGYPTWDELLSQSSNP